MLVRVCRRSPAAPLAPPHTQPASAGSARAKPTRPLMVAGLPPALAGAMMGWSARPHKAGPRRNLFGAHRVRGGPFQPFCPCSIVLVHVRTPRGFCSCSLIVFRPCPCARRDVHVGGRRGPGHGLRGARCGFWCASLPHLPSAVELCSQFANRAIVVSAAISPCISLYLATARYISLTTAEIILYPRGDHPHFGCGLCLSRTAVCTA